MKKFVPVMLTPFKENGEIDYEGLKRLIDFYLDSGAGGMFANCLSSEMYHLSREERVELCEFVVRYIDGKVPVVATGSFGINLDECAHSIKEIYATGVQGVIVISGLLSKENAGDHDFRLATIKLLENTGNIPLGFYECPVPYKRIIRPEHLGELVDTGRVIYHKDTCLDINQVKEKLKACEKQPSFGLYDAYMVHAVESLKAGSAGLSCIQGNYFPELVVWLCKHYTDESDNVKMVQNFFIQNMDLMHRTYPASAKYLLGKRELPISEFCRNGSSTRDYGELDDLWNRFVEMKRTLEL